MKPLTKQEEQIILAIYHLKEKAYLVNIREKLKEYTGKSLDVGTINKPLIKLSNEGYLHSYLGDPSPIRGGKAKKYYSLTENAYIALKEVKTVHDKLWESFVFPKKIR